MFTLTLTGTITSKRAFHVPVIRRWRLVWERREFGTKVDEIRHVIPLRFADWAEIPDEGLRFKLVGDVWLRIERVRPTFGEQDDLSIRVGLEYLGIPIPSASKVVRLPIPENVATFPLDVELYRGVTVAAKAKLWFRP